MPAVRSRTENWRQSLESLASRGGSIELALPGVVDRDNTVNGEADRSGSLIWRVRVIEVRADAVVVERPSTLGVPVPLEAGVGLVGIIAIGQNRWMFRTGLIEFSTTTFAGGRGVTAAVIKAPDRVERCQRREFYRVKTVGLSLPTVTAQALLDPGSIGPAEAWNRIRIQDLQRHGVIGQIGALDGATEEPMPELGPSARASLLNIGGGGVGLLFASGERHLIDRHRLLWMGIDLPAYLPTRLWVAGRVRHTHLDSSQQVYAGVAFEFSPGGDHERFVVDQICRAVAMIQREQMARATTVESAD